MSSDAAALRWTGVPPWLAARRPSRSEIVAGVALLLLAGGMGATNPTFLSTPNLSNLAAQVAIAAPIALGMTFVLIVKQIDLSVASVLAFTGVMLGVQVEAGLSGPVAIVGTLLIGTALGMINGALVGYAGLNSFMVTLAMLSMARGAALTLTDGQQISGMPDSVLWFGSADVGPLPASAVIVVAMFIAGSFVLKRTRLGRSHYAVGANHEAARVFGLPTKRVVFVAFTISGALAALAAVLVTGRLATASPIVATGWELNAITAAVLGGTSLLGGKGTALGAFIGVCFLSVLDNGLGLFGVSPFYTGLISGLLILSVIIIDRARRRGTA